MGGAYLGLFGTAHSLNPKEGGGLMLELGYAHDIAVPGNDELFAVSYDQTFNFTTESSRRKRTSSIPSSTSATHASFSAATPSITAEVCYGTTAR